METLRESGRGGRRDWSLALGREKGKWPRQWKWLHWHWLAGGEIRSEKFTGKGWATGKVSTWSLDGGRRDWKRIPGLEWHRTRRELWERFSQSLCSKVTSGEREQSFLAHPVSLLGDSEGRKRCLHLRFPLRSPRLPWEAGLSDEGED